MKKLLLTLFLLSCNNEVNDFLNPDDVYSCDGKEDSANDVSSRLIIPLLTGNRIALSTYNQRLKNNGLSGFPNYLSSKGTASNISSFARFYAMSKTDGDILGVDFDMIYSKRPSNYYGVNVNNNMCICYVGDPSDIQEISGNLIGSVFSDQYISLGWRHKENWGYGVSVDVGDEQHFPDIWRSWDSNSESMLVIYSIDDSGNGAEYVIYPKCY